MRPSYLRARLLTGPEMRRTVHSTFLFVRPQLSLGSRRCQWTKVFHAHPHRAVRIKLSATAKNYLIIAAKRPKQFEKRAPVGCARQPVPPEWAKPVSTQSQKAATGGHAVATGGSVDLLWPELCHAMETELARLHGCGVG